MALVGPPPISFNPVRRLASDLLAEHRTEIPFPPGEKRFSIRRTRGFATHPLPLLLDGYERFGPVFTMRVFHGNTVFMIGPEANHYMTVSHARNFSWREGHMGDLTPLLGDGLLTIDGDFHRRSRRIMLPAFHHTTIAAALATMNTEIDRALEQWRDASRIDIYYWTGAWRCGSRCARCSASTLTAPARGSTSRAGSNKASASGRATTGSRSCAGRAARSRRCRTRGARSTG